MEKLFITIVILYALFVAICLLRMKLAKKRKRDIVGKGNSNRETSNRKTDIVGKSRFDLSQAKPLAAKSVPLAATSVENEKRAEDSHTFAPENKETSFKQIPQEELDEVFADTPPDENNDELLDIDYPLEYESDDTTDDEADDEENEEEEVKGASQAAFASGAKFEELGNAVRTVHKDQEASPAERQKAGETLLDIRGTDMFEQLVSEKPGAKEIIMQLMTEGLNAFYKRKDEEKENNNKGNSRKVPDNFNIRDFV